MNKPKKHFGQHFLVNQGVILRIAEQVERAAKKYSSAAWVVEIGPGKGALTAELLGRGLKVLAIELDDDMIQELQSTFSEQIERQQLKIIKKDALRVESMELLESFVICGNLPYNVGSAIVTKALNQWPTLKFFCFMLQKEVVEKFLATAGKNYGPASVRLSWMTQVEGHFWVRPGSFFPPPKVDSGVFWFSRRDPGQIPEDLEARMKIVDELFQKRRKMIRGSKRELLDSPWAAKRPEDVTTEDFITLTNVCLGKILGLILCFVLGATISQAGPWEDSFLGIERSAHQDSLGWNEGNDLFSVSANPAWLPKTGQLSSTLSYHKGSLGSRADESPEVVLFGMGACLKKGSFGAGLLAVLPFLDSAVVDTGRTQGRITPWTARNRQVQMQPFLGKAFFSDQLSVGLMFPISFDVKSESQLKMDSSDPNTRIKAGMDPNITWGAGLLFKMSGTSQLSASYRERKRSDAYVNVNGSVPVSGAPDIEILASGSSPYIYEPRRATLQSNFKLSDKFSWGIWARFNQWKEMPAPVLLLVYTSPSLSTARPDFRARNTVEVATGLGWELAPNMTAYFSYRYSPSPFKNSILFYDRNTHHLGFGMAGFLNSDWKLGFFGRISLLEGGGIYSYAGLGGSLIL